ncbi:MAG: hypothetical protein U5N55_11760 [Cypionkella sp.]|nr:hypothetical protein [Cypionkella sp.]
MVAAQNEIKRLTGIINAAAPPKVANIRLSGLWPGKVERQSWSGAGRGRSQSGPSQDEINDRFNAELRTISQRSLAARAQSAKSAEERAEFEFASLEFEKTDALEQLRNNKEYSTEQRKQIKQAIDSSYESERVLIEVRKQEQLAQEAADLLQERNDAYSDELKFAFDQAKTQADRRTIALDIVEAEYAQLKAIQDAILLSDTATKAEKDIARLRIKRLEAERGRQTTNALDDTAGRLNNILGFQKDRCTTKRGRANALPLTG